MGYRNLLVGQVRAWGYLWVLGTSLRGVQLTKRMAAQFLAVPVKGSGPKKRRNKDSCGSTPKNLTFRIEWEVPRPLQRLTREICFLQHMDKRIFNFASVDISLQHIARWKARARSHVQCTGIGEMLAQV